MPRGSPGAKTPPLAARPEKCTIPLVRTIVATHLFLPHSFLFSRSRRDPIYQTQAAAGGGAERERLSGGAQDLQGLGNGLDIQVNLFFPF